MRIMKNKINFGVIGCSQIANVSTIPAILESKNGKIMMIGSRTYKKAEEFSKKFGCKEFGTYEEVLENNNINAVYISVPVGLHKKWAIKAANAGKHILCEKSSSGFYNDSVKMVREAKKNEIRILEGFMFRFHPSHKKVKEIIKSNRLGKIYSFFGRYGFPNPSKKDIRFKKDLGGGIINDAGCYPVCASRMIFEEEPIGIMCQSTFNENGIDIKTSIQMKFDGDKIAQMVTGYGMAYQSSYSLWGTKGTLRLTRAYNIPSDMKPQISLDFVNKKKIIFVKPINHFKLMIDAFTNEITTDKKVDFLFEDELLKQAKVMEAVRISSKKNKFVKIKSEK